MSSAREGSRAARRRQLADLYQAGNEDPLLRRRRPKKVSSKPAKSRVCREKEMVRREEEKALYGSIAETVQFGQRRAWHYGYRNKPGLSGSGPVGASARYGAVGTLRMMRRDASASRGGSGPREDDAAEGFQVDEWSPMLRCSTAPSLATTTTPKAWPESAMYPHGSQPKRLQPSPWYDGETTANEARAATAGPGMRRAAASHGFTMSILEREALLETTNTNPAARGLPGSPTDSARRPRPLSAVEGRRGDGDSGGPREGKAVAAHARTPKRLDQEMGFLKSGVYFTAPKDPLRGGLGAALAGRLARQTDQDGLKWDLLKQVLRAITGSQHGLPLQAVKDVAATFGAVVGTSKLANKAQFVDHITGNHVGFPESELTTLFGFFRSPTRDGPPSTNRPPPRTPNNINRKGSGGSGAEGSSTQQGADWTVAVACLRLLVRPKEPVMASALGVFDVFARARGDRALHARRLEQERLERERQDLLEEERERWKRRRRREREMGVAPSGQQSLAGPEVRTHAPLAREGSHRAAEDGEASPTLRPNRASFAETARMFTLVCSNDQERHAVTTTYRHRFRLELRAVMRERRSPVRSRAGSQHHHAESGGGSPGAEDAGCPPPRRGSASSKAPSGSPPRLRDAGEAHDVWHVDSRPESGEAKHRGEVCGRGSPDDGGEQGVTAEEFSEALVRCPEMLEAFGSQLAARFRHRHRPVWMAPFLRKGG
eukprot:g10020.t3